MIPGADRYGHTANRAMQEDEQNQDDLLRTILRIISFMDLTDTRQNLANLRDLESNLPRNCRIFLRHNVIRAQSMHVAIILIRSATDI